MVQHAARVIVSFGLMLLVGAILGPHTAQGTITFETGDFIGTVLDQGGQPVAGVTIFAQDVDGHLVARAVTDASGLYQIESLQEGEYRLTLDCRGTGYQGQTIVAEIAASGSVIVDWRLSHRYPARTIATPAIA